MANRKNIAIFSWLFLIIILSITIFVFPSVINERWELESFKAGFLTPIIALIPSIITAYKRDTRLD